MQSQISDRTLVSGVDVDTRTRVSEETLTWVAIAAIVCGLLAGVLDMAFAGTDPAEADIRSNYVFVEPD